MEFTQRQTREVRDDGRQTLHPAEKGGGQAEPQGYQTRASTYICATDDWFLADIFVPEMKTYFEVCFGKGEN